MASFRPRDGFAPSRDGRGARGPNRPLAKRLSDGEPGHPRPGRRRPSPDTFATSYVAMSVRANLGFTARPPRPFSEIVARVDRAIYGPVTGPVESHLPLGL
jgi:hypothetical protein